MKTQKPNIVKLWRSLALGEYPSIKVAEKEYKKLFPDTFDELVIIEATEYL